MPTPKDRHADQRRTALTPARLWPDEPDAAVFKSLAILLKSLASPGPEGPSLAGFCLRCRQATAPRVACLGCAGVFCLLPEPDHNGASAPCFQRAHQPAKPPKCLLGRLFPAVKRSQAPGCLARTTSAIFGPRGFRNLGNSCYMNVVLQILLRIPELQAYFLTDHHNRLKHRTTTGEEVWCCACELIDILQLHHLSAAPSENTVSPVGFLFALWTNSEDGDQFAGYRQSDAHECLLACLNQLHTATQVPLSQPVPSIGASTTPTSSDPSSVRCQCPIDLLFRCELTSLVWCGNCGQTSHKVDPILDLSLEIGHFDLAHTLRLEDCLHRSLSLSLFLVYRAKASRLKDLCYTCNHCLQTSPETTKSLSISRLPHILCIQLKRFEHQRSSAASKIDRFVKFPLLLDMQPFSSSSSSHSPASDPADHPYFYQLTGIVRHQGNVSSGHYQAIVYQDDQYFCFNDENVSVLRLDEVLKIEAYLLVYTFIGAA
ncbi:hypothetical protein PtB15_15B312 [Puccinia triticina]|nr:hypothetical protein PtB15_15B312 [Puccinia triticina]